MVASLPGPEPRGQRSSADAADLKQRTIRLLEVVAPAPRAFDVRFWDGSTLPGTADAPDDGAGTTLVLASPDALGSALEPPLDLSAGEAFVRGDIDIEGDIGVVFDAFDDVLNAAGHASLLERLRLAGDAAALRRRAKRVAARAAADVRGRRHSRARDARAIRHHYDLPVEFYRSFLDRRMTYSCAYFAQGDESLDEAQEAKLDLVCRKLRLRREHRLLDIGCGWGSLVGYAAERYGANSVGVTLAERQVEEARQRLHEAGVEGRASVELRDYRDLRGSFDRVASVGMSEHVGRAGLEAYFRAAWNRLAPGGLMLNHAITRGPRAAPAKERNEETFIQRYVFPDGEIVGLSDTLQAAEAVGFEVRDVEDLREHYATTLRHWVANLEAAWDHAVAVAGRERARVWRLYMAASAHQFTRGRVSVHQVLLGRPDDRGFVDVPRSRTDLLHG